MDFLKAIFGEKPLTFDEFSKAIDAHNGNEENKENQIKLGNLGSGEYISKMKHDDVLSQLTGTKTELKTANDLIAELKKASKGNEEFQTKINSYETQVEDLQKQLAETKLKSALKVALLSEKAVDVDYLTFKINEKLTGEGKTLELDDNESIKGWDDLVTGLKTQFPNMFEHKQNVKVEPHRLPDPNNRTDGLTKAELLNKPYAERQRLFAENPDAYKAAMNS